jgi:hypothetical protein
MVKLPWQETLLQVLVVGSKWAPAAWIAGFWEKSTAKPVGEWHASQVRGAEKALPWRWTRWFSPAGAGPAVDEDLEHADARKATAKRARVGRWRSARMTRFCSHGSETLPM